MKRTSFLILAILVMLLMASTVCAEDGPVQKLGRGIANVVTSPFELTKGMGDVKEESGIFAGLTWGILQGTVNVVKRAVVGVCEIATFPLPLPKDYKPILDDPEFMLEKEKY